VIGECFVSFHCLVLVSTSIRLTVIVSMKGEAAAPIIPGFDPESHEI